MMRFAAAPLVLALLSSLASADPLSYDYVYLSHQQDHVDGRSFQNDTFGAYKEIGGHFHLFGSLGNAGAYGNPAWKNSRAVRAGTGARVLLDDDTLIAFEGAVVRAQFDDPVRGTIRDTGLSAIFEIRHRFAPWLEAIASASHSDVLGRRTDEFVAGPVFHLNRHIALGAFYRRTGGSSGVEVTARTYY